MSNQQSISSQISGIINSLQNVSQRFDRMIQQASKLRFCTSCKQKIDANDYIEYLNKPYHRECVKCSVDNCTNNDLIEEDGKLICNYHFYQKKLSGNPTPDENKSDTIQKFKKIFGNEEGENAVGQEAASDLVPNTNLHVTKPPEEIDKEKLDEIVGEDGKVVGMKGVKNEDPADSDFGKITSTIVKIAILASIETHNEYLNDLKSKLRSSTGQAVIGNLVNEPVINYPPKEVIEKAINKPSFNQLQSTKIEITEEEQKEIQRTIIMRLKSEKGNEDFKFVIYNQQLYDELEAQLRKDLEDNPYELIVVAQTVITSKHYDEYNEIKCQIPPENIIECFFYHGSKLDNHPKIAQTHFLLPGKDDMKQVKITDPGFYGQGIYSTDNVFYAALYGNGSKLLTVNNSTTIIGCRAIYNKDKVKDMYEPVNHYKELSHLGKKIDDDITDNFGAHCALVGSSHKFLPIQKEDIYKNRIYANEFVFPNKFQFIPCYSFRIMRKDHYILWKCDNEANKKYSKFMEEIKEDMEVNVYHKDDINDAATLIKKKKYAALKLITNTTDAEYLIKRARKIIRSNFVCLVYADKKDQNNHMKWISEMENVLFTKDPKDFKKFAALEMNIVSLLEFIDGLKRKYETDDYHFKINEKKLLHFPNCIKTRDIYYKKYYEYPKKTNENQDNLNQSNQNQDNKNQSNQNQDNKNQSNQMQDNQNQSNQNQDNLNQNNQNQDNQNQDNQNQDNEKKDNEKKDNEKKDSIIKYFVKSIASLFW